MAQDDIAEGGVRTVGGAREQDVFAIDFPRKEHAVAIERHQRVLHANEGFEILRPPQADGGAGEVVTPRNIIPTTDFDHARIVGV